MTKAWKTAAALLVVLTSVAGCAAQSATDAPSGDEAQISDSASITVNGFTLNALKPSVTYTYIGGMPYWFAQGGVTITGGTGTQKQGVCMLKAYVDSAYNKRTCTAVTDCSDISIPTGGSRYCLAIDNVGSKYCFTRPGTQTNYCAGSPANGGAAVGNGTYMTPKQTVGVGTGYLGEWISDACVAGCATTDPSVSSSSATVG